MIEQLRGLYPGTEMRIEGRNFAYIANASHYSAASFPDSAFLENYASLRAPAHFNQPFFHVLRATEARL
jgi:hypothetical protein